MRAYTTAGKQFVIRPRSQTNKWVKFATFGASFGLGWFLTQHMTFADIVATWRYDKVPENDEGLEKYKAQLSGRLERMSVVKQLKQCGYSEVFPPHYNQNTLINKSLSVPGGITIPPKFYYNPKSKETVGIYHLGMKLTGYPFLVHGGILATVMEDLMRESVKFAKNATAEKTKDISLSYKFPTLANQFVVVRITNVEESGKNVELQAEIMDQGGNRTLVKGRGSFSINSK